MNLRLTLLIAAAAGLTGCASFTNNTTQPIVVSTTCGGQPLQGATCRIMNANGSWTVQSTPGAVMVRKAPSDMAVDCRMPQATAMPVVAESHATTGAWGNLLVGGLIGFGVDSYRDAAWKYDTDVVVDMCKGVPTKVSEAVQRIAVPPTAGATSVSPMADMQTVMTGEMKYAFSAEALAKQRQCSASPRAVLNARGPATEVYTVGCNDGNTLMLKCTYGTCVSI